jgi:hypothetical protein
MRLIVRAKRRPPQGRVISWGPLWSRCVRSAGRDRAALASRLRLYRTMNIERKVREARRKDKVAAKRANVRRGVS